ncbi:MAG: Crp/Fnr family transcriptional regulator [Nannocystaceae bacterium]|nr:Crp/Fnr family transcriptional regulator [Nannocystaceae bacterium]
MPITANLLAGTGLLRAATPESIARLARGASSSEHGEGEVLWRAGEPATALTIIRRGLVQIVKHGAPASTLGLFGPRECPGLVAVLGPGRYPADALAVSEHLELIHVPSAELQAVLEADHALAEAARRSLVAASQMLLAKIDVLTAGEVPQRLATLFLHLVDRFGDTFADGETRIPVVLSRSVLARLVGARSETVIRVMTRWEREGALRTERDGFVIRDREWLVAEQATAS